MMSSVQMCLFFYINYIEELYMKLGLCTIAFRYRPLEEVISIATDYGFDGIEILGQEPHMPATYDS